MLGFGLGLACWKPGPQGRIVRRQGSIPGDVGTFSPEGGFKRLFNIWDDEDALRTTGRAISDRATYRSPEGRLYSTTQDGLHGGDTLVRGTSSQKNIAPSDQ